MYMRTLSSGIRMAVASLLLVLPAVCLCFADPLDQAARPSPLASRNLLLSVARAGDRVIAVGQRGHIVYSDDRGVSWEQAVVPVSSDLTAVWFASARAGWAVGHDGVILHSADGGKTWAKQLDGHQANALMVADLERKVASSGKYSERAKALLAEATRYRDEGPDKPFLDVWFSDEKNGFAVGAYNLIFRTSDGGVHWESWFDRTDNPDFHHLNAIRGAGGEVYVVGERGRVLWLDTSVGRFVARPTPYAGSFFALAATSGYVTAFGMRGNAFRSGDKGLTWKKVDINGESDFTAACALEDGRIVAVSQAGQVMVSRDHGLSFDTEKGIEPMVFAAVSGAGGDRVAVAGIQGVRIQRLR